MFCWARPAAIAGQGHRAGTCAGQEFVAWQHLVEEAVAQRPACAPTSTAHEHVLHHGTTDRPFQHESTEIARDAELELRHPKLAFGRADTVVGGERDLQAEPDRVAVDGGDDRYWQLKQLHVEIRDLVDPVIDLGAAGEVADLVEVPADTERTIVPAVQHDGVDVIPLA